MTRTSSPTASKQRKRSRPEPALSGLARLRRWLNGLFSKQKVVEAPAVARRASVLDKQEAREITAELSAVLNQHPKTREVMRYACALEHGFMRRGRFTLDDLPIDVIRRALAQLDEVVTDWNAPGLGLLRSKAAVAIADRERIESERHHGHHSVSAVEVEEASVTTFMEANEEWERSFTGHGPLDEAPREPPNPGGRPTS